MSEIRNPVNVSYANEKDLLTYTELYFSEPKIVSTDYSDVYFTNNPEKSYIDNLPNGGAGAGYTVVNYGETDYGLHLGPVGGRVKIKYRYRSKDGDIDVYNERVIYATVKYDESRGTKYVGRVQTSFTTGSEPSGSYLTYDNLYGILESSATLPSVVFWSDNLDYIEIINLQYLSSSEGITPDEYQFNIKCSSIEAIDVVHGISLNEYVDLYYTASTISSIEKSGTTLLCNTILTKSSEYENIFRIISSSINSTGITINLSNDSAHGSLSGMSLDIKKFRILHTKNFTPIIEHYEWTLDS